MAPGSSLPAEDTDDGASQPAPQFGMEEQMAGLSEGERAANLKNYQFSFQQNLDEGTGKSVFIEADVRTRYSSPVTFTRMTKLTSLAP